MLRPSRQTQASENKIYLAAEQARAEALFASIGEAVIATNEDGKIMKVNEAALELWGYTESDLIGKKYMNVIRATDINGKLVESLARPIIRALLEGKSIREKMIYVRKDGSRFPASVTVSPIMVNGKPMGTIEVIRDITREQQIDLAKTEFVSLASHQLRTPLTAVRWYLELLLKGRMGQLTDLQQSSLQEVYNVNLRLIELVSALLSVARIEIGTLAVKPVLSDIQQLARDVVVELMPQIAEKHLQFNEEYDHTLQQMALDPDLTHIVFQNLLTNAVKYTPDGGKVTLKVERVKRHILIQVIDNGYGVPKNQQRHLFTKLFRADNVRQQDTNGTGLGLYIVHSIVKSSKGKIWFESVENKGTTFYVQLPIKGMLATKGEA
jgi:PAS domain S-box-containing protein